MKDIFDDLLRPRKVVRTKAKPKPTAEPRLSRQRKPPEMPADDW